MHYMLESGTNCSNAGQCSNAWRSIITNYCQKDETYEIEIPSGSTVVWKADKKLNTNIRIRSGGQLIIKCRIGLPDQGHIIVDRGGRLIVDGGTLTHNKTMWPRCTDGQWGSIIVAGNTEEPHHPDMKNDNYPLDPDGPGIVLLRNAVIEYAHHAISTRAFDVPWPESDKYRGGFVYAENTVFRNNHRSAEFLKFDQPNFSAFVNCNFEDEDGMANWGITNWACNGILVKNCAFAGLNETGILVYDGGITVVNSTFRQNTIGIEGYATYPLASNIQIGTGPGSSNLFANNFAAIYGNAINSLFVQNNDFHDNIVGVAIQGESQYQIAENDFKNSWVGINLVQSSSLFNLVNCNTHEDLFGIHVAGDNRGLRFWRQDFSALYDILVANENVTPGQIHPFQGSQEAARWNYFSSGSGNNAHVYTLGNTIPFNYFHPDPSNDTRLKPKCAQNEPPGNCATLYNFNNFQTTGDEQGCIGDDPPGMEETPCLTKTCLEQTRLQISELEGLNNPTPQQEAELAESRSRYAQALWRLVNEALSMGDSTEVETLLTEDGSKTAQRRLLGLKLKLHNYAAAQQLLNAYPPDNTDDVHFIAVQGINLRRLSQGDNFLLTGADEAALYAAVASREPSAAYAKGLLSLLKGETFRPELPEVPTAPNLRGVPVSGSAPASAFRLYPVPARRQVTIEVPVNTDTERYRLEVYDLYGRRLFAQTDSKEIMLLDSGTLGTGVFTAVLLKNGRPAEQRRFILLK